MQRLFAEGGIAVLPGTTEDLSGNPALQPLQSLDVGQCGGTPTAEQTTLFTNRNNVSNNELVVYIVANLIDASGAAGNFLGCATHPSGQPGAAVVQSNARWLVAHEVGHVLGLAHVCEVPDPPPNPPPPVPCGAGHSDSLMFPNVGWTNQPPDLAAAEYTTMLNSGLSNP